MYRTVFWTLSGGRGMIWENGIETCIASYKKRIASPGLMQDTGCLGWCTGVTQRDGMGREAGWGGGSGFVLMYGNQSLLT